MVSCFRPILPERLGREETYAIFADIADPVISSPCKVQQISKLTIVVALIQSAVSGHQRPPLVMLLTQAVSQPQGVTVLCFGTEGLSWSAVFATSCPRGLAGTFSLILAPQAPKSVGYLPITALQ